MTKTIDWGDGSGDKIYLDFDAASGAQDVSVRMDANSGDARSKVIKIATTLGGIVSQNVTLSQKGREWVEHTIALNPSAFVSGQYQSISNQTNPVGKNESNTTYATVNLKTGSNAETYAFWKFDTSSIPANAQIVSVTCKAKGYVSNATSNYVQTRTMQMYSGTGTAKGSSVSITTTAKSYTISCGTWTRSELDNLYIRIYAKRKNKNTTTSYNLRFYGATVTIVYKV